MKLSVLTLFGSRRRTLGGGHIQPENMPRLGQAVDLASDRRQHVPNWRQFLREKYYFTATDDPDARPWSEQIYLEFCFRTDRQHQYSDGTGTVVAAFLLSLGEEEPYETMLRWRWEDDLGIRRMQRAEDSLTAGCGPSVTLARRMAAESSGDCETGTNCGRHEPISLR